MSGYKQRVLLITGLGRSGSTVLQQILNEVADFRAIGEFKDYWTKSSETGRLCSCGKSISDCEFWEELGSRLKADRLDYRRTAHLISKTIRTRYLVNPYIWNSGNTTHFPEELQETLDRAFLHLRTLLPKSILVDSSKHPMYGVLLESLTSVDLYILHLVRDPRAVAYSWGRKGKFDPDTNSFFPTSGLFKSSLIWSIWNTMIEQRWQNQNDRYMVMRYEDFVSSPVHELSRISDLFALKTDWEMVIGGPRQAVGHSIGGNPVRFEQGKISLKEDLRWKQGLSQQNKNLVSFVTTWVRHKWGY